MIENALKREIKRIKTKVPKKAKRKRLNEKSKRSDIKKSRGNVRRDDD